MFLYRSLIIAAGLLGSVLLAGAPVSATGHITWQGSAFVYNLGYPARGECNKTAGGQRCYAVLDDNATHDTHYFAVRGLVPQDMPTTPSPRLTCNFWGTSPGGTGTAMLNYQVAAYRVGSLSTGGAGNIVGSIALTVSTVNYMAKTANETASVIGDVLAGTDCAADASCIGVPFFLEVWRTPSYVADTLDGADLYVTAIDCTY